MHKIQIPFVAKAFFAYKHFNNTQKNILLTFAEEESAIKAYKQLKFIAGNHEKENILYFPSLDTLPYDRISPNPEILSTRASILTTLSLNKSKRIVVTNAQNLIAKIPPASVFANSTATIYPGSKLSIEQLAFFLINSGFIRVANAIESGEFAIRGEIIDVVKSDNVSGGSVGYRINFGWEAVESIKQFDLNSQISIKPMDKLDLSTTVEALLTLENLETFRNNFLKYFGVNHTKSAMYESIMSGQKFQGYEHLLPLLYNQMAILEDYLGDHTVIYDNLSLQSILEFEKSYNDFYEARLIANKTNPQAFYYAIPPVEHVISSDLIKKILESGDNLCISNDEGSTAELDYKLTPITEFQKKSEEVELPNSLDDVTALRFNRLFELVNNNKNKIAVVLCNSRSAEQRIKFITENHHGKTEYIKHLYEAKKNIINIAIAPLSNGFLTDEYLFLSEQDLFGNKFTSQSHKLQRRKLKNILTELDNIDEGDLIVHKEHGIGKFEKIETLVIEELVHDCLKIIYSNNDILYLPVENIDLITKYGGGEAELDKLGGVNWQKRKARLKNRIKDIAAELIKTTAKRQLCSAVPVNFDPELYTDFCNQFPYSETEDQLAAIEDIEQDLKSGKLADRLICGDVGFGKTEVAMRAAFMTVFDMENNHPQVAVISPTTILCRQHYQSFLERFKKFSESSLNLKIVQLSRLVSAKESKEIKKEIEKGEANIIIGTQALLAKNIKFKNLKLLIIDEEQHFGVNQKEHLKALKSDIHVLSLSATPIPRTMQMSMSGIRDLSLITTPPIDRLPVRTTVTPFDGVIIRDALMRERFRGGKSFYVVPRIKEIEWVAKKLEEYVPELTFKVAHGQMPPADLDKVMNEFCDGKFDILLSTTIIESGIDISAANTIVIHRADMLGLSQLYQLRGRVGRGKIRGYAYLTLINDKTINKHSWQRLEILQNIDSLGAGFTIASHDMDLRGFGNLVGEEQSGHVKEVGSELYQEMLDEAIAELKNNSTEIQKVEFAPSINIGMSVYIPQTYIEDSALRLAIYRRVGDLKTSDKIENFKDEMVDRFGPIPLEFTNLLEIVQIKNKCFELKIENFDAGPNGFVIKFNQNFDVSDIVMSFVAKHPRHTKIKPDNKLVFLKNLKPPADILQEVHAVLDELNYI